MFQSKIHRIRQVRSQRHFFIQGSEQRLINATFRPVRFRYRSAHGGGFLSRKTVPRLPLYRPRSGRSKRTIRAFVARMLPEMEATQSSLNENSLLHWMQFMFQRRKKQQHNQLSKILELQLHWNRPLMHIRVIRTKIGFVTAREVDGNIFGSDRQTGQGPSSYASPDNTQPKRSHRFVKIPHGQRGRQNTKTKITSSFPIHAHSRFTPALIHSTPDIRPIPLYQRRF